LRRCPAIHDALVRLIYRHGGQFAGTCKLSREIPASERAIFSSLHCADRYGLIVKNINGHGRQPTVWKLTPKGKRYARSK
jgi:hypothetical protein